MAVEYFLAIWALVDPIWPLTPTINFFQSKILPIKVVCHRGFLSNLTPGCPSRSLHDLQPYHCTTLRSGVFLPNSVVIGNSWAIWFLVDPGWPLHDLWLRQCITHWSGVLPTKCVCHREFLSNLIPNWPWLTHVWPWQQQCITFQQGFFSLPHLVTIGYFRIILQVMILMVSKHSLCSISFSRWHFVSCFFVCVYYLPIPLP